MEKTQQIIYSTLFAATLLVPAIGSIPQLLAFDVPAQKPVLNGELTRTFEKYVDDEHILKKFATNVWAAISYKAFGEGRNGVIIGTSGWLFTDEEFDPTPQAEALYKNNLQTITNINATLKSKNIELVVAILPAKSRVYGQYLQPGITPSSTHQTLYDRIHQDLSNEHIKSPSLLEPMIKSSEQKPVFLHADTHWTPWGAESAATVLSGFIKDQQLVSFNTKTFSTETVEKKAHQGDLLNYLPLSPWFDFMNPFSDTIEIRKTVALMADDASFSEDALFADTSIALTLVGSSYSANPLWNFAGALAQNLGVDLLNVAKEGQGPVKPMQEYLQSSEFRDNPPQLVIWEFPERYLLKDNTKSEEQKN